MAVTSVTSFPVQILDGELKECVKKLDEHISLTIKQAQSCDSLTVPESNAEDIMKFLQTLQNIPTTTQELSSYFFLFCMKLLQWKSSPNQSTNCLKDDTVKEYEGSIDFNCHILTLTSFPTHGMNYFLSYDDILNNVSTWNKTSLMMSMS